MTVREAIERAKALHPSTFTDELILAWLNECEGSIQKEIFRLKQEEITKHTLFEEELLVEFPYDKLYPEYLGARIRYNNGEYEMYQNIMQAYNAFYKEYAAWWQRTHATSYAGGGSNSGGSSGGGSSGGNGGGADGFSPIIRISDIPGGHRVIITDAQGLKMFDVPDGYTPVKGKDYFTEEEIAEIEQGIADKVQTGEGAVLYNPQDLSKEQQSRARANISAVSIEEVNTAISNAVGEVNAAFNRMDEVIG